MGYCEDDCMVRVDFFKPSGKWYTTEAVKWTAGVTGTETSKVYGIAPCLPEAGFVQSLRDHFKDAPNRLSEMTAVCLENPHEYSYPLMLVEGRWRTNCRA